MAKAPYGNLSTLQASATRRAFLSTSGAALTYWTGIAQALAGQDKRDGKAKSVILIFNCGGPSHLDLWDPKPAATDSVRGPFQTIDTAVPGIRVTELIPNLAQRT